ncbi:MAG: hypothetical protein Q9227_007511 [Pyrenula ochraceoflavens]
MAPTRLRHAETLRLRTDSNAIHAPPSQFDSGDKQPPLKRARYMPGGRGGGGRHVYPDGTEIMAAPILPTDTTSINITPKKGLDSSRGPESPGRTRSQQRERRQTLSRPVTRPTPRQQPNRRPNQTSASAVAAHGGNNNNPREEQSYQSYHPEFDIDLGMSVLNAAEVDGTDQLSLGDVDTSHVLGDLPLTPFDLSGPRSGNKKRGRPKAWQRSELSALGNPMVPKQKPPPYGADPRERLDLNKPSYHVQDTTKENPKHRFPLPEREVGYRDPLLLSPEDNPGFSRLKETNPIIPGSEFKVEYDMDEQDSAALKIWNEHRKEARLKPISDSLFEVIITLIENYWFDFEASLPKPAPKTLATTRPRSSSAAAVNGEERDNEDRDANCCICDIGEAGSENPIVFCDGCDIAVHQYCYGVQHIPGGDWLCRKCWLVGRNTSVNCVLCPNTDGAFKTTSIPGKWAHVLCALWVPEISIGNTTVIEPINDVEKLPRDRLNLQCYICQQKMGSPVQCQQMGCFTAFHITCARRAGLYSTPMNSNSGSETLVSDSDQLRGYCHKHGSKTWRATHDVDATFAAAKKYYRETMKNVDWKNVLSSTPQIAASNNQAIVVLDHNDRGKAPRCIPKTAYGADHIPNLLLKKIEDHWAVTVYGIKFGQEEYEDNFIGDCCAYWTCKREARGNAPLIRRHNNSLMEQFPSLEVGRRDYVAMGAAGRPQLADRVDFTGIAAGNLDALRKLGAFVKDRESCLAEEADMEKRLNVVLHHQLADILQPIRETLNRLFRQDKDCKYEDQEGFSKIRKGLDDLTTAAMNFEIDSVERYWATVISFLSAVFDIEATTGRDFLQNVSILQDVSRPKRRLAKKVISAMIPLIETATHMELDIFAKPYDRLGESESFHEAFSRRMSTADAAGMGHHGPIVFTGHVQVSSNKDGFDGVAEVGLMTDRQMNTLTDQTTHEQEQNLRDVDRDLTEGDSVLQLNQELAADTEKIVHTNTPPASTDGVKKDSENNYNISVRKPALEPDPPTPPLSMQGKQVYQIGHGGIPWFAQAFDPDGLTLHEEKWTGRELVRDMSEELSEMGDDELHDLGGENFANENLDTSELTKSPPETAVGTSSLNRKKANKNRRRYRGFR